MEQLWGTLAGQLERREVTQIDFAELTTALDAFKERTELALYVIVLDVSQMFFFER